MRSSGTTRSTPSPTPVTRTTTPRARRTRGSMSGASWPRSSREHSAQGAALDREGGVVQIEDTACRPEDLVVVLDHVLEAAAGAVDRVPGAVAGRHRDRDDDLVPSGSSLALLLDREGEDTPLSS